MDNYTLEQLDRDQDYYFNSGPNPGALIAAGQQLAAQYPGNIYAVKYGQETLWQSNGKEAGDLEPIAYRLIRNIRRGIDVEIAPGDAPEHLIAAGEALAAEHPEWTLEVKDKELKVIWTNKKSAPSSEAGDATENG